MGLDNLVDVETAAAYCGISAETLQKWTESGHAPHYYIAEHGPLYKKVETKDWVKANLLRCHAGMPVPTRIEVLVAPRVGLNGGGVPLSLATVNTLLHVPLTATFSGVYFLCDGPDVVYVGQAVNVMARICSHIGEGVKKFDLDRIFCLPCPRAELSEIEKHWILHLRPRYNRACLPRSEWVKDPPPELKIVR